MIDTLVNDNIHSNNQTAFDKEGVDAQTTTGTRNPFLAHDEVTTLTFRFSRFLAFFSMMAMADATGSPPSTSRLPEPEAAALGCCCGCCWVELFLGGILPLSQSQYQLWGIVCVGRRHILLVKAHLLDSREHALKCYCNSTHYSYTLQGYLTYVKTAMILLYHMQNSTCGHTARYSEKDRSLCPTVVTILTVL